MHGVRSTGCKAIGYTVAEPWRRGVGFRMRVSALTVSGTTIGNRSYTNSLILNTIVSNHETTTEKEYTLRGKDPRFRVWGEP